MLFPGGILCPSVPVGRQRVELNAHRVFAVQTVLELTSESFELLGFSYIDDAGLLHENVAVAADARSSFGLEYACGIFDLRRKTDA